MRTSMATKNSGKEWSVVNSQVHSGSSSTASAPTGTLFVGRAVPVVARPPGVPSPSLRNRVRHTLRIGCTELKAVPHAGLGYHYL